MEWMIYDKTRSTVRCIAHKLQYSGTWMGECFVTVDITSPSPIDFAIGDYLEYRGERFEMNYDPSVVKKARKNSIGDAFTYSGVKFNSLSDELARCDFLDYVKSDNNIHYTSLPTFSFYASSIQDLADRIQVNLDRIYTGDKKWTVVVHPEYVDVTDVNIDVNNIKVWDALGLAYSKFKATYIIRGRTITIGTAGIAVDNMFKYGKGNGLKEIERQAESDQQIVTRLRAYGSTKNLPHRYYANLGRKYFVTVNSINSISPEQTILSFNVDLGKEFEEDMFTRKVPDVGDEYSWYHYYVSFEVYGITVSGGIECFPPGSSTQNKRSANLFARGEDMGDEEKSKLSEIISLVQEETPDKVYITSGVNIADMPSSNIYYLENVPNNMAVNHLMLPGFPDETIDPYIDSDNITELGVREATVFFDGSTEELEEIYPTMEGMTADDLREAGISISLDSGDNGKLDEVVSSSKLTDDGSPNDKGEAETANFTVTLKDIGFDINDYLTEESATLIMKNGMCGGREFTITKAEKSGNKWVLTCERVYDDSIGLFFPNSDYTIDAGDKYVLVNINMPDVYIAAASQRLLTYAKEYLAENDYVRYAYFPKVDDIYMAREHDAATAKGETSIHDSIKEGDLMLFEDEDLNINGSIIIDQLTIKEGESIIPQYTVTLREEKVTGSIQKLQNQIDSIVSGGLQGGGGLTTQQVQSIVRAIGAQLFLRKDQPDSTRYLIGLLAGATFGVYSEKLSGGRIDEEGNAEFLNTLVREALTIGYDAITNKTGATISKDGAADFLSLLLRGDLKSDDFLTGALGTGYGLLKKNAAGHSYLEIDELFVRMRAFFTELEIKKLSYSGGNFIFSPAGIVISRVEETGTTYKCYFVSDDGETATENMFRVNDLVLSQTFNIKEGVYENVGNRRYWRAVTAVGDDYIELSKTDCESGSDIPQAGDSVVTLGNKTDTTRQNAIIISVYGEGSPSFTQHAGIKTYSLEGTEKIRISPNGNHFTGTFVLENGKTVEEYIDTSIGSVSDRIDSLTESIEFVESVVQDIDELKKQVDGAIETWFYEPVPTLNNAPAVNWTTTELKNQHLGDLYYSGEGKAYRFQMEGSNYVWQVITDSDITLALANAQKAQDTADGKRRVFVNTPTASSVYDVGDLWVNATYGSYNNDLLRCKTAKTAGQPFSIDHWELASKYTDDTKANQAIKDAAKAQQDANQAAQDAQDAKNRLDEWADDGVISPTEKQSLKDEIARIDGDYTEINNQYSKYNLGTPSAYNTAYTNYRSVLVSLSASTPETISIPSYFETRQTTYYTQRSTALNAIAQAAKDYAEEVAGEVSSDLQAYKVTVESKFTATNEAITAAINSSKTYTDEQIANAASGGGVNLLRMSGLDEEGDQEELFDRSGSNVAFSRDTGYTYMGHPSLRLYVAGNGSTSSGYGYFRTWLIDLSTGGYPAGTYTLSFYARVSAGGTLYFTTYNGSCPTVSLSVTASSTWKRYNVTIKPTTSWCMLKVWKTSGSTINIYMALPQLQEGGKATGWQPAPEDLRGAFTTFREETETELSVMDGKISSKIDQSTLTQTLSNYVTNTTYNNKISSIEQTMNGITSTVSQHTQTLTSVGNSIDTLSSRVTSAESSIQQNAQQIQLKVSQSEAQAIAEDAIEGLQIGGSNLVKGSATWNFASSSNGGVYLYESYSDVSVPSGMIVKINCTTGSVSTTAGPYSGVYECTANKKYTWTFYARASKSVTINQVGFENGGQRSVSFTTTRQKFTHTFTANSGSQKSFVFYGGWSSGLAIYIDSFKVEEGEKSTDWDANADDMTHQDTNLLEGTKNFDGWEVSKSNNVTLDTSMMKDGLTPYRSTLGGSGYYKEYTFESGKFYTLSAWVRVSSTNQSISCGIFNTSQGTFSIPKANKWYRWVYCFKCGDSAHPAGVKDVQIWADLASASIPFWVCGIKLEEGIVPSPWTTALGEYATINEIESSLTMTANGIKILGKELSLVGKVTFSMLSSDVADELMKDVDLSNYIAKDELMEALESETVIVGGYINTSLIKVNDLLSQNITVSGDATITNLHAVNAIVEGEIIAGSGTIGKFKITNAGLYKKDNAGNEVTITPEMFRLKREVTYAQSSVSSCEIRLGENADPNTEDKEDFRTRMCAYFYRRGNIILDNEKYFPAVQIVSDNVANANVALRTDGGTIVANQGVIEQVRAFNAQSDFNFLPADQGSNFMAYNTVNRTIYFPSRSTMQYLLGVSSSTSPVVRFTIASHPMSTQPFTLAVDGASATFYDHNGNVMSAPQLDKGDSFDCYIVYESSVFVVQLNLNR